MKATESAAWANVGLFVADLLAADVWVRRVTRWAEDDGDGRYVFQLSASEGWSVDVGMPGVASARTAKRRRSAEVHVAGRAHSWGAAVQSAAVELLPEPDNPAETVNQ